MLFLRFLLLTMTNWLIKLLPLTVLFAIGTIAPPSNAQIQGNDDRLITIESDTQSADNITGVVTALGNVRIVYPSRGMVATSRQAQYFSKEALLILSGDVDVVQEDGNTISAERITYNLDDERAEANPSSGQQVQSTLLLNQNSSPQTPLTP